MWFGDLICILSKETIFSWSALKLVHDNVGIQNISAAYAPVSPLKIKDSKKTGRKGEKIMDSFSIEKLLPVPWLCPNPSCPTCHVSCSQVLLGLPNICPRARLFGSIVNTTHHCNWNSKVSRWLDQLLWTCCHSNSSLNELVSRVKRWETLCLVFSILCSEFETFSELVLWTLTCWLIDWFILA